MSTDSNTPDSAPSSAPSEGATAEPGKGGRSCRGGRRRRHWRKGLVVGGLLALALFALPRAFAHGFGGGGCDHDASWSAEDVREHTGWLSERMVDRADGSDAQQKQVEGILNGAAPDVIAFHDEARELRTDVRDALTAPTVSRDALEEIRKDGLDLADRASAKAMDTLVAVAAVFTPEQRQKLAKGWAEHHGEK